MFSNSRIRKAVEVMIKIPREWETKVTLTLNEKQAKTVQKALELYARIGMGQIHDLCSHPSFERRSDDFEKVEEVLDGLKEVVFADLNGRGHLYEICSEEMHEECKEAFTISEMLRRDISRQENSKGDRWSVLYDRPANFNKQLLPYCKVEGDR